ncbi:BBE domain-containing protein [Acrocarpospora corrugata]|uniref:BBE domain-containing protein n=1 Tax=Acrocarpospora corrugata TaxID=35763 RepID=UPI0012D2E275
MGRPAVGGHPPVVGRRRGQPPRDEGPDGIRRAHGGNYERLAEVKRTWDPENVFRLNQNVPPAG